jgi:uncharacterized glyoxalase superfamily protein PhnB
MTSTHIWPSFRYRDARAAIRFLRDAFGFEEVAVYAGETEEQVAHAELRWAAGGGIMLGSAGNDGAGPPAGTGSVYVVAEDVDALHDRAQGAGAEIIRPLRDEEYGNRTFTARDPEGVIWSFGTYAGEGG